MISGDEPEELGGDYSRLYPGESALPLTANGIEALRNVADEETMQNQIIAEGLLFSGLMPGSFAHIRYSWLERENDRLYIQVPGGEMECDLSAGRKGRFGGYHEGPCFNCESEHDGMWSLNRKLQPRRVYLPEPAVSQLLEEYLSVHKRLVTPSVLKNRLRDIGEKAGFDRRLSGINLRMTFGKLAAEKGFSGNALRRIMGHPDTKIGRYLTTRYYLLSSEHDLPPYRCHATKADGDRCQRIVSYPDKTCPYH